MTSPSTTGSPPAEEWTVGRLLEWTAGWLRSREADFELLFSLCHWQN